MSNSANENQPALDRRSIVPIIIALSVYGVIAYIINRTAPDEISAIAIPALLVLAIKVFEHYENLSFRIKFWNIALMVFCLFGAEFFLGLFVSVMAWACFLWSVDISGLLNFNQALLEMAQELSQRWVGIFLLAILVAIKAFSCSLAAFVGGWAQVSLSYIEVAFAVILQLLLGLLLLLTPSMIITIKEFNNQIESGTSSSAFLSTWALFCILYVAAASVGLWLGKRTAVQAKPPHEPDNENAI